MLAAALVAGAALAGCAGGSSAEESAATGGPSSSASPSVLPAASTSDGTDQTSGLVPAEAFGADAQVTPVPADQLVQGALAPGGSLAGAQVTPEACAAAVRDAASRIGGLTDLAAEVAVRGTTATAELLASGGPVADLVAGLPQQVAECPQAQVSSPEHGTATIDLAEFDVPALATTRWASH